MSGWWSGMPRPPAPPRGSIPRAADGIAALIGVGLITAGTALWSWPAALIVAGIGVLVLAVAWPTQGGA